MVGRSAVLDVKAPAAKAPALGDQNAIRGLVANDDIGGYAARSRAATLLSGLGFPASRQAEPVARFSGGWRMRLNLAQALMCRSDLLLLDEPTNHLDLASIEELETALSEFDGAVIAVSHDRSFLQAIGVEREIRF
jgi:ATP-binding cassette subfamily F protein 3